MKITLSLNIFLFIVLFVITKQLEFYTLIMIFALIHELSHLICGILLGLKPEKFKVMPLGFCVVFKTNTKDYNKKIMKSNIGSIKKIIIALAGPIINLIIVIIGIIYKLNENIIYSNLLILMFNIIPIYPLDGGRILKNVFKLIFGTKMSNTYTNVISNITIILLTMLSSILILLYKNIAILIILIILWIMVIKENKRYKTYNKIYKVIDKTYNYL